MLHSLVLQNFKCFSELRLQFGNLTLLTGYNGGGKSTAIQPLLFLAQNLRRKPSDTSLFDLNGDLVKLGTIGDVISSLPNAGAISFRVETSLQDFSWSFSAKAGERALKITSAVNNSPSLSSKAEYEIGTAAELKTLTYLSVLREGTSEYYPIPDASELGNEDGVGVDGRFSSYWYDMNADEEVDEARRCPTERASTFRRQVDGWLSYLFPGAQANVQAFSQLSLLGLQFRLSGSGAWRRPANIGYGLSYAFPILIALLTADKDELVIIDSPEAHLHPSAQSNMGRLLATFANAGVQILVETHSDHLLNGVRLAVKEALLPAKHLRVHFFTGALDAAHGVISPNIDASGRLDEWPSGFFDQSEKDLSNLSDW